jgi:thioredoxin-related protein
MALNKIFFVLFLFFSATMIYSQANWTNNFDKSYEEAVKKKKPILVLFTGSDWCPPCKMLEKNIFSTSEFEEYAKKNLVLIKADFPRRPENQLTKELQQHNQNLSLKYGIRGFPTVILMDNSGKELDRSVGYRGNTATEYINKIKELTKNM